LHLAYCIGIDRNFFLDKIWISITAKSTFSAIYTFRSVGCRCSLAPLLVQARRVRLFQLWRRRIFFNKKQNHSDSRRRVCRMRSTDHPLPIRGNACSTSSGWRSQVEEKKGAIDSYMQRIRPTSYTLQENQMHMLPTSFQDLIDLIKGSTFTRDQFVIVYYKKIISKQSGQIVSWAHCNVSTDLCLINKLNSSPTTRQWLNPRLRLAS
jgi:hypothetical protein